MAVLHCISVIFVCPKSIFFLGLNIFLLFLSLFLVLLKKKFLVFLFSSPPERRRIAAPYLHANFVIFLVVFIFVLFFWSFFNIYIFFPLQKGEGMQRRVPVHPSLARALPACRQGWHLHSLYGNDRGC